MATNSDKNDSDPEFNFGTSERDHAIILTVLQNPDIHHNELLRSVLSNGSMAKTTFERLSKKLVSNGELIYFMVGNKKCYRVAAREFNYQYSADMWKLLSVMEQAIKMAKDVFPIMSLAEKVRTAVFFCQDILHKRNRHDVYILDVNRRHEYLKDLKRYRVENEQAIKKKFEELLNYLYDFTSKDPNGYMINHMMEVSTLHTRSPSTDELVAWHAKHTSVDTKESKKLHKKMSGN